MSKERVLTEEAFNGLLSWLDLNRDEAGKKYEAIRQRLIKIFTCRGCMEAEELADETFNRVALKIETIRGSYTGDPALYFYGVAHKIHLEYLRRSRPSSSFSPEPPSSAATDEIGQEYGCLERCMQNLSQDQRELVLSYYQEDKRAKIENRRRLAEKMGIALNALRIRAHRIRAILQQCVQECLDEQAAV